MIILDNKQIVRRYFRKSFFLAVTATAIFLLTLLALYRLIFFLAFAEGEYQLSDLWKSFHLGVRFDLRVVAFFLLPLFLQRLFSRFPHPRQWSSWFTRIFHALLLIPFFLMLFLDFGHYSYLKERLNATLLDQLGDAKTSFSMVWQTYPVILELLLLTLLVAGTQYVIHRINKYFWYVSQGHLPVKSYVRGESVLCFVLLMVFCYGKISRYPLRWSDAFFSQNQFINQLGLNPHLYFFESLKKSPMVVDEKELIRQYPLLRQYFGLPASAGNPTIKTINQQGLKRSLSTVSGLWPSNQPAPSFIIVQMESLAFDKTSLSGNPLDPTPHLKSLLKESLYFPNFFTPTEATARGLFATLTSIPDVTFDKSTSRNPSQVKKPVLLDQLKGYEKYFFIGGSANWGNIRSLWTANVKGIKIFEEGFYQAPNTDVWGVSDADLFVEAADYLAALTGPFAAYLQSASFHRPYTIPNNPRGFEVRKNLTDNDVQRYGFLSADEYNSMRFQDHALGLLMDRIRRSPLKDRVIVAIFGDHGLPSKGEHIPPGTYLHRVVQHHVPFLLWSTQIPAQELKQVGSQLDILPTLLPFSGQALTTNALGKNLLAPENADQNHPAFLFSFQHKPKHISAIDAQWLWSDTLTGKGLYAYRSLVQGQYMTDQSSQYPEQKTYMENLAKGFYEMAKFLILRK